MFRAILYICQDAIGDIIISLPHLEALRSAFPSTRLVVAVNRVFADLFEGNHCIDDILRWPPEIFLPGGCGDTPLASECAAACAGGRFDCIIDTISVPGTAAITKAFCPLVSAGIGFPHLAGYYTNPLSYADWLKWGELRKPATECFGDVVRQIASVATFGCPSLPLGEQRLRFGQEWASRNVGLLLQSRGSVISGKHGERSSICERLVAFNPGAGCKQKRWGLERFLEVADSLEGQRWLPVFVFGPKEEELRLEFEQKTAAPRYLSYTGHPERLGELAGVLSRMRLIVTNDTGAMHVGGALGVSVVALFAGGLHKASVWFRYVGEHHKVFEGRTEAGPPHTDWRDSISIADVTRAASVILSDMEGNRT